MEKLEARLIQYRVLADHRLHFGKLYFQVIGLNLTSVVGAMTAIGIARPAWWMATRLLAGLVLVGTSFVAHRLHYQERTYASALRSIEEHEAGMVQLSGSQGLGARQFVVVALAVTGLLLAIEAARHMIGASN